LEFPRLPHKNADAQKEAGVPRLFAYPIVGRAGLGNCLFPWARAELFARNSGARVLAPRWTTVRLGPYLRRDPDKRRYGGFFRAPHHCRGLSRWVIQAFGRRIKEEELDRLAIEFDDSQLPCVVEFRGMRNFFVRLLGEQDFLRSKLWEMTRESLRPDSAACEPQFIAMHVRRTDFLLDGSGTKLTPVSWFISMAESVRSDKSLRKIPIIVFTDSRVEEISELARMEGVRVQERQAAITDLLMLSHAGLLFASGWSTFGMWASFLGQMPTIYGPGKLHQRVQPGPETLEIELEEAAAIPERAFAQLVVRSESKQLQSVALR
jgi:hypothetical protein